MLTKCNFHIKSCQLPIYHFRMFVLCVENIIVTIIFCLLRNSLAQSRGLQPVRTLKFYGLVRGGVRQPNYLLFLLENIVQLMI